MSEHPTSDKFKVNCSRCDCADCKEQRHQLRAALARVYDVLSPPIYPIDADRRAAGCPKCGKTWNSWAGSIAHAASCDWRPAAVDTTPDEAAADEFQLGKALDRYDAVEERRKK